MPSYLTQSSPELKMASKCSLLAFTVVCLVIAGTSASPGSCQERFDDQSKKLGMATEQVSLSGKCSIFDPLKAHFTAVLAGCPFLGEKLLAALAGTKEYVCRCIGKLRACGDEIKSHEHFCQKFEEAANCSAYIVDTECKKYEGFVEKIIEKGQEIFDGTCKKEKCDKLFQRDVKLGECYLKFKATVQKDKCGASTRFLACGREYTKDCKYLTDKFGKKLDRFEAVLKKKCPASEVRGFDLIRGFGSVDLFGKVEEKTSAFSKDALDEMMRDFAEPAETRETGNIASLKKLIDLLKVMDAKN